MFQDFPEILWGLFQKVPKISRKFFFGQIRDEAKDIFLTLPWELPTLACFWDPKGRLSAFAFDVVIVI